MPEISTLLQSLIAYLDQQTLESKYYMALHAEPVVAEAPVAEAPAKKPRAKAVIELVRAEPAVAEPAVAEPAVAATNVKAVIKPVDEIVAKYRPQVAEPAVAETALSDKDAKAIPQYEAERLAAMNVELDYEKDVAPAIRNHAIDVNKRGAVMDALLTYGVKNGKSLATKDYASFLKHLEEQVAAAALGLDWYDYMDSLEA